MDNVSIQVERTEQFLQTARELSVFIQGLPLNSQENDKLISLVIRQVVEAERGAFIQGFRMGMEYGVRDKNVRD